MERDEWERTAQQEQVVSEEARSALEEIQRELELMSAARGNDQEDLAREKEKTDNLESVLHDFQAGLSFSVPFFLHDCILTA